MSAFSPNQNAVVAWSVCKVYVNPTTHAVTCYSLSSGATGNVWGVSGNSQTVNSIAVADNGDVYVGGDFATAGGLVYSSNIGCFTASSGWQQSRIFTAFGTVDQGGLAWDSTTKIIEGTSKISLSIIYIYT